MRSRVHALANFILERYRIYRRRKAGALPPWTRDNILQTFRFCNVYREDDRVTRWITKHWRMPFADYEHLWFSLVIARLINHPPTLERLALPGRWNRKQFVHVVHDMQKAGKKAFGSAYIVSTNGKPMDKAVYLATEVLDPMWEQRRDFIPEVGQLLDSYHRQLCEMNGMGSFIAAQVIADLKYVPPLVNAPDWWTFASSGPGSRRGLNRVLGNDVHQHWTEDRWRTELTALRVQIHPYVEDEGMKRLHAQDLQNCLCEFDKYERARLGEGRPKQNFVPQED